MAKLIGIFEIFFRVCHLIFLFFFLTMPVSKSTINSAVDSKTDSPVRRLGVPTKATFLS